jgi:hypothetical protein
MKMVCSFPDDIFDFMLLCKFAVKVEDCFVVDEIFVGEDQDRDRYLLGEDVLFEWEEPGIQQDYVGHFLFEVGL